MREKVDNFFKAVKKNEVKTNGNKQNFNQFQEKSSWVSTSKTSNLLNCVFTTEKLNLALIHLHQNDIVIVS